MNLIEKYNALDGKTVTREELKDLAKSLKISEEYKGLLAHKAIERLLDNDPDTKEFTITLKNKINTSEKGALQGPPMPPIGIDFFTKHHLKIKGTIRNDEKLMKGYNFAMEISNQTEDWSEYNEDTFTKTLVDKFFADVTPLLVKDKPYLFEKEDRGYTGYKWKGKAFDRTADLDITEIAKLAREEYKIEFPEMKWSVRIERYSGGQSINAVGTGYPRNPYNKEYMDQVKEGKTREEIREENWKNGGRRNFYTEEYKKDLAKAEEILSQYRVSDSDGQIDYFSTNFYDHVRIDLEEWDKKIFANDPEILRKEAIEKEWAERTARAKVKKEERVKAAGGIIPNYAIVDYKGSFKELGMITVPAVILKSPNGASRFSFNYNIRIIPPEHPRKGFKFLDDIKGIGPKSITVRDIGKMSEADFIKEVAKIAKAKYLIDPTDKRMKRELNKVKKAYQWHREQQGLTEKPKAEAKPQTSNPKPANASGAATLNPAKKGIEIKFDGKPADSVRECIKAAGFKWSRNNGLWYAKDSEKVRKALEQCGIELKIEGHANNTTDKLDNAKGEKAEEKPKPKFEVGQIVDFHKATGEKDFFGKILSRKYYAQVPEDREHNGWYYEIAEYGSFMLPEVLLMLPDVGQIKTVEGKVQYLELLLSNVQSYKDVPVSIYKEWEQDLAKLKAKLPKPNTSTLDTITKKKAKECHAVLLEVSELHTDTKRFQNRKDAFSEMSARNVAENFDANKFDPVVVWTDPKLKKDFVISGHSRLEGMRRLKADLIPARYFEGTEAEAMKFARVDANRTAHKESFVEDLNAYKLLRDGDKKQKIEPVTKAEIADTFPGKANKLEAYTHLNPAGPFITTLSQDNLSEYPHIENRAMWAGELAQKHADIWGKLMERNLFYFFYRSGGKGGKLTKKEFFELVQKRVDTLKEGSQVLFPECESDGCKALESAFADKLTGSAKKKLHENQELQRFVLKRLKSNDRTLKVWTKEEAEHIKKNVLAELQKEEANIRKGIKELEENQGSLFGTAGNKAAKKASKPATNLGKSISRIQQVNDKAREIRKKGESWQSAQKRAGEMLFPKKGDKGQLGDIVDDGKELVQKAANVVNHAKERAQAATQVVQQAKQVVQNVAELPKTTLPFKSMATLDQGLNQDRFNFGGGVGTFLGNVERKPVGSVVMTLDAPQGSGKTRMIFQILNEIANSGYSALFASKEEHPQSGLFIGKRDQYISPQNMERIAVVSDELRRGDEFNHLKELAAGFDCILIDSMGKFPNADLDELRNALHGKFIVVIYQRTQDGKMRGGSAAAFDADMVCKVDKGEDFRNNEAYWDKNRYNDKADQVRYNIYDQKCYEVLSYTDPEGNQQETRIEIG